MDPAYSLSKSQLLDWLNTLLQTSLTKVEQCASGAVYCQIIDSAFPGRVPLKKVNWMAKVDYEYVHNYKILQRAFDQCNIAKHIDVDKLCKGKFQDNLEFLQWMKAFYDSAVPTDVALNYDPVARRQGCQLPSWATKAAPPSLINKENHAPRNGGGRPPTAGRTAGVRAKPFSGGSAPVGVSRQQQQPPQVDLSRFVTVEEYEELKESAVCLERERDFYFGKLRQVEILLQEIDVTPSKSTEELREMVQTILYPAVVLASREINNQSPRQWVGTNTDLMRTRERILTEGRLRSDLREHCYDVQRNRRAPSHRLVSGHGGSCCPRRWVAPTLVFVNDSRSSNHTEAGGDGRTHTSCPNDLVIRLYTATGPFEIVCFAKTASVRGPSE
ncbi:Integrator complex subunit 11 [Perkinsus olseni]|nr:Integrator complex subunit 11 [Perkinsus olseni]